MSVAVEALRVKLERVWWGDTGTGGLTNASSAALCRGFYHGERPSNPAYPHIFYRLITEPDDAITSAAVRTECPDFRVEIEIDTRTQRVPLESYTSGQVHNFGFGLQSQNETIAAVVARLVTVMTTTGNWNTAEASVGSSSWFFSRPDVAAIPPAEVVDTEHVRQRMTWTVSAFNSATGPPTTGSTLTIAVNRFDSTGGAGAAILTDMLLTGYEYEPTVEYIDDTRKLDIFDRRSPSSKGGTVVVDFTPAPAASVAAPTIPYRFPAGSATATGQMVRLAITVAPGKSYALFGFITSMRMPQATKSGGKARGRLRMVCSCSSAYGDDDTTPQFGPAYSIS